MEILFQDKDGQTLKIAQCDRDEIILTVKHIDDAYDGSSYYMNKTELRDFIGALLHIQQKLNKGGNHE